MTPGRLAAFANVIAGYCQAAGPGERVLLEWTPSTEAAVLAVAAALEPHGAIPVLERAATLDQGVRTSAEFPNARALWDAITGYVGLRAVGDGPARRPDVLTPEDASYVRQLRMTKRKTTTVLPDAAVADRAGMSLAQLEDYYAALMFLDEPEPAAGFEALKRFQAEVIRHLEGACEIRIVNDRTDLRLSVAGRPWQNSYGRRNTPSGEMFTSPIEDSADGVIHFDVPSHNFAEPVRGVTLEFRQGTVVAASAEAGSAALEAALGTDAGSRRLGEIGIGGNRAMTRFVGATLFDEKVAGTAHLALGKSYPQAGGRNESALHWDLIIDLRSSGRLLVDGEPLLQDGEFLIYGAGR
mgnify:FL=1